MPLHISKIVMVMMLFVSGLVWAEQKTVFDNYDVHYSVVNTDFLSPEVARAYGIIRAKDKALLNIAIRKRLDDNNDMATPALVSGRSSDLMRSTPLLFKEIIEQDAIYYIATLDFHHLELRKFIIAIKPFDSGTSYELTFTHTFYRD